MSGATALWLPSEVWIVASQLFVQKSKRLHRGPSILKRFAMWAIALSYSPEFSVDIGRSAFVEDPLRNLDRSLAKRNGYASLDLDYRIR